MKKLILTRYIIYYAQEQTEIKALKR